MGLRAIRYCLSHRELFRTQLRALLRASAHGNLRLPGIHSPLPAMLYSMPGPRSYTGQDCVEIHTISSPPLVSL